MTNPRHHFTRLGAALALCLVEGSSLAGDTNSEPPGLQAKTGRVPSAAEWQSAPLATAERIVGPQSKRCTARTLRGWLSVRCEFPVSAMTQLGGSRNGVTFVGASPDARQLPQSGTITFPTNGAPRVFLFWSLGEGYDGPLTVVPAVVLSSEEQPSSGPPTEETPNGQPRFRLHDALHEPVPTAQNIKRRLAPSSPPASPPSSPGPTP